MFKIGLLVTLVCLTILIEESQSCWYLPGPNNPGQAPNGFWMLSSGKKKRDVAGVEEYEDQNAVPMEEKSAEMEMLKARANKFQSRK